MATSFPVEFSSSVFKLESLVGMHCVEVPASVIKKIGGKLNIRLICTLNESVSWQCGLVALGNGAAYFSVNPARRKKLGLQEGDKVRVKFEKDESEYGMEVPPELTALLQQDDEGRKRFDALPPGKRRYIIFYVSGVKNSQKRIARAILLIENLKKLPLGKESFREMLGLGPREE